MAEHRHIRSLGVEREGQAYFFGYDEGPEGPGQVRLETLYTGLSAGTELTFLKNTNPYLYSRWDEARGVFVSGEAGMHYPLPFLGYMEVARVIAAQAPGFAAGDVVAGTFGHKTVGLFTALFARRAGAAAVVVCDPAPFRRNKAEKLGFQAMTEEQAVDYAKSAWHSGSSDRGADVVFQTRAHGQSLHNALKMLRPQGAVIDLAFYQGGASDLRLGEEFHHNGLAIRCAQIGRVPRGLGVSWDRRRLAAETIALLEAEGGRIREEMITHLIPFDEAPAFLEHLVAERPDFLQVVFRAAA